MDRAAISDLLIEFARALDERHWDAYAQTYAEDGVLSIAPHITHHGRAGLAEIVAGSLSGYAGGTPSPEHQPRHAHRRRPRHCPRLSDRRPRTGPAGPARRRAGWYDTTLTRTEQGWRFATVTLTIRYVSGEPVTH